jgi:Zn-dependent protease
MPLPTCADCRAPLDPTALSCPTCHALTHAHELESLAEQAQAATHRHDLAATRDLWARSLALLPPDTVQYRSIRARIAQIDAQTHDPSHPASPDAPTPSAGKWGKGAAGIGPALLLALSKGKLLLLGLTKLGTLLSMIAFAGVYWALYGWPVAVGMVLSIYIHEMGHVLMLRSYGIPASAPMFIPGFGAFISMRGHSITRIQDSRVGLAGPIYGFGAALFALALAYATGNKTCAAIAHFNAVINLFNLIPVWQLDGSRGFASLTRTHRIAVLSVAAILWLATSEPMLFLIAIAALLRLFTDLGGNPAASEPDQTGLLQFLGILSALTAVAVVAQRLVK